MKQNFAKAQAQVLVYDGGYSNHPPDSGGPANKGFIQRVYDGCRRGRGEAPRSVRELTRNELFEIFRRQSWDRIQGDRCRRRRQTSSSPAPRASGRRRRPRTATPLGYASVTSPQFQVVLRVRRDH